MIKIENVEVVGWEYAIRGMRNPLNSWDKSDSEYHVDCNICNNPRYDCSNCPMVAFDDKTLIGSNDLDLMKRLAKAGTDHRKFMRMIVVYVDVTAPMYWWAEYDTYKVGTVRNSCSKIHKLLSRPFEMSDFSFDKLVGYRNEVKQFRPPIDEDISDKYKYAEKTNVFEEVARPIVDTLNELRDSYLNCDDADSKRIIWYSILQLLPESYNQRATLMLNYEVLANIYHSRKAHKLDEWRDFCRWVESLPYSELITGGNADEMQP